MLNFAVTAVLVAALASGGSLPAAERRAADSDESRGTNVLLVGIDRRTGISAADRDKLHVNGKECDCTDVMMVVHLSRDRRRMSVVSVPRDSYVAFAAHDHPLHSGKINAAFKHGGPELAVRTVEHATGLDIDHYLETDFTGFAATVDRLGGATLCTDKKILDAGSGLKLAQGTHHVKGNKALRYTRARKVSPPGDLGRVRRQQRLLVEMAARLREAGAFRDPATAVATALELKKSVRTDADTSLADLMRLGLALGRIPSDRMEFATVPISEFDHRVPEWGSTLLWDAARSAALWEALRKDRPMVGDRRIRPSMDTPVEMAPSSIRVRVDDAVVAAALSANGYAVENSPPRPAAPRPKGPTVITYDPFWERYAPSLAAAVPGATLRPVAGHGEVFDMKVGTTATAVIAVVHDRSSVEGAPTAGDRMRCPTKKSARADGRADGQAGGQAGGQADRLAGGQAS